MTQVRLDGDVEDALRELANDGESLAQVTNRVLRRHVVADAEPEPERNATISTSRVRIPRPGRQWPRGWSG